MEQTNVVSQKQKRQEDLELHAKHMDLRVIALKMGIEFHDRQCSLYVGDEEFESLISTPIEYAEEFYNFLKG